MGGSEAGRRGKECKYWFCHKGGGTGGQMDEEQGSL